MYARHAPLLYANKFPLPSPIPIHYISPIHSCLFSSPFFSPPQSPQFRSLLFCVSVFISYTYQSYYAPVHSLLTRISTQNILYFNRNIRVIASLHCCGWRWMAGQIHVTIGAANIIVSLFVCLSVCLSHCPTGRRHRHIYIERRINPLTLTVAIWVRLYGWYGIMCHTGLSRHL